MKIQLSEKYLSLQPFESEELPDFTVITGLNGSGKSQLLEAIYPKDQKKSRVKFLPYIDRIMGDSIKLIGINGIDDGQWQRNFSNILLDVQNIRGANQGVLFDFLFKQNINPRHIIFNNKQELNESGVITEVFLHDQILQFASKHSNEVIIPSSLEEDIEKYVLHQKVKRISSFFEELKYQISQYIRADSHWQRIRLLILEICEFNCCTVREITDSILYNSPIHEKYYFNHTLESVGIGGLFYNYIKRRDANSRAYYLKKEYDEKVLAIPDSEFIAKNPTPWSILNDIFNSHGINFSFKGIDNLREFTKYNYYDFPLLKNGTNEVIPIDKLSSGESQIIGLIVRLFLTKYFSESLIYPELIILDEPDANLHPELTKLFVDVLTETFVKKLGIKIIMTTHSPTTVALCPDESIFEMKNGADTSLRHIGKDAALKILTAKIPFLSVDYRNHRQVFTESPDDVLFYQTIYEKLSRQFTYPKKIYFISYSFGQGNCDQVNKVVSDLNEAGNENCYGIVDWDDKVRDLHCNVKVHGNKKRYSLENYLFDPIYVLIFLIRNEYSPALNELGISKSDNELDILKWEEARLQEVADWYFEKYYSKYPIQRSKSLDKVEVEYYSGKKLKYPRWFLEEKGHDFIEKNFKEVFEPFKKSSYKRDLINIIGKCYPFIPLESKELIEDLAGKS